jgi:hypothetical protein
MLSLSQAVEAHRSERHRGFHILKWAHRLQWGQPYAPVALYLQEDSWNSFLLRQLLGYNEAGRIMLNEKPSDLLWNRTRDFAVFGIVSQLTTLQRVPLLFPVPGKIVIYISSFLISWLQWLKGISYEASWRMVFFGILRRVALVRTDVSEELSASFISVRRIGELRKNASSN